MTSWPALWTLPCLHRANGPTRPINHTHGRIPFAGAGVGSAWEVDRSPPTQASNYVRGTTSHLLIEPNLSRCAGSAPIFPDTCKTNSINAGVRSGVVRWVDCGIGQGKLGLWKVFLSRIGTIGDKEGVHTGLCLGYWSGFGSRYSVGRDVSDI